MSRLAVLIFGLFSGVFCIILLQGSISINWSALTPCLATNSFSLFGDFCQQQYQLLSLFIFDKSPFHLVLSHFDFSFLQFSKFFSFYKPVFCSVLCLFLLQISDKNNIKRMH